MKKAFLLVFFTLLLAALSHAQVKVGATPTGKHAKAINTAKGAKEEAKARREQARQIKEQKKAIKKYEKEYARLKNRKLKEFEKDSIEAPVWTKEDSVAVAEEVLADLPLEYREVVLNPVDLDSLAISTVENQVANPESLLESQAKEFIPQELEQADQDPLGGMASDPLAGGSIPGNPASATQATEAFKKPTKPNPNLVKPDAAKALFKKIDPEQFQKAQADITKLKNKYSSLPDTRFPSEGRKRNSLEDVPFKKRLYFGGNVNATSTDPLIMDISLQLGYWINKKWLAGAGMVMREQFNQRDSTTLTGDSHGFSLFMRYDILKQFFAWGESQHQVNRALINSESSAPAKWQQASLVGIGRNFKIGPVQMTSLIMYDFNYRNNNLNGRPFVFRLGVQLTKNP